MRDGRLRSLAVGLILLIGSSAYANAATVTWQDETFTGISNAANNSNFDSGLITFAGFLANEITDIFGSGVYHNHSGTKDFDMHLRLNGVWTEVWIDIIASSTNVDRWMDNISTPISFALSTVSGIRLSSEPSTNQAYHLTQSGTGTDTNFVFSNVSTVPLPAGLPLVGTALGALGWFGWFRRHRPKHRRC